MKKIIALLLCAVMCLSFAACGESDQTQTPSGEDNNEQGGESSGENSGKIERGTVTSSDNPLLPILLQAIKGNGWSYSFKQDGSCSPTDFWWIYSDESDRLAIYIASERQYKYDFVIFADGTVAYNEAAYHGGTFDWMPGLKNGELITFGILGNQYDDHPFVQDIFGTWQLKKHLGSTYDLYSKLVLRNDGSCAIDDFSAYWKMDESSTEDLLVVNFYKEGSLVYVAWFSKCPVDVFNRRYNEDYPEDGEDVLVLEPCATAASEPDPYALFEKIS